MDERKDINSGEFKEIKDELIQRLTSDTRRDKRPKPTFEKSGTSFGDVAKVDSSQVTWFDKIKETEVISFIRHLSIMMESGLSLVRALNLIALRTQNKKLKQSISSITKDVEEGTPFWKACAKHGEMFSNLQINLIKAGEIGGSLSEILVYLAEHGEREKEIKDKVKGALWYPAILVAVAIGVILLLLLVVVPLFEGLFKEAQVELPLPTKILIAIGNIVSNGPIMGGILILIAVLFFIYTQFVRTEAGRNTMDRIFIAVPIFGTLIVKSSLVRFGKTLSILLRSGVPILHALDLVVETCGNRAVGNAVHQMKHEVERGGQMEAPLHRYSFIPTLVADVIAIGQESGKLPEVTEKMSEKYEREVKQLAENITKIIEPILLVILGVAIAFIAISLYYPYFKLGVLSLTGLEI